MKKLGIWNVHEGEMEATIETPDNLYEAFLGWLADEDEREARFWRFAGMATRSGQPLVRGFDEVIYVWPIDNGTGQDS